MYWLDPDLGKFENRIHSQFGEDGIIAAITQALRINRGYYVEFGVGPRHPDTLATDGIEANTRVLKESGWAGLWMDGHDYPPEHGVQKEWISVLNINLLLEKYKVPKDFDLISIDIDGQDPWVWMALDARPKIVIIECNGNFDYGDSRIMPFDMNYVCDGTTWFGGSITALGKIGESKGYVQVYTNAINSFFVRKDLLQNASQFDPEQIHRKLGIQLHQPDTLNRPWIFI